MRSSSNEFEDFLASSYDALNVYEADILYIYSDFRYFGKYLAQCGGRDEFCGRVIAPLLEKNKTIIMTTFTYTTEGIFDVYRTFTKLGAMNKWLLMQEGVVRSEHPLFSYASLGSKKKIVENIGKSAFGHDSIFDRLKDSNAAFLHIGRPVSMGNTAIHHVEQLCGATYRVPKAFKTKVYRGEQYVGTDYTASLRRRDVPGQDFGFTLKQAAEKLFNEKLVRQVGDEESFSNLSYYRYDETLSFLEQCFYEDPTLFIKTDFIQY
jgi:aminoglycoside N3'-acetyltransferase